jgi:hypothetical protein
MKGRRKEIIECNRNERRRKLMEFKKLTKVEEEGEEDNSPYNTP